MDVNNIVSIISSVGFPIVACCAMGYYVTHELDDLKDDIKDLTITIRDLCSKLDEGKGSDEIAELYNKNSSARKDK